MAIPALVPGDGRRMALHRARQAHAERLHWELQRSSPRRAAERDALHLSRSRTLCRGKTTTTLCVRTAPSVTCRRPSTRSAAIPRCNGAGRCAHRGAPRSAPLHHPAWTAQM